MMKQTPSSKKFQSLSKALRENLLRRKQQGKKKEELAVSSSPKTSIKEECKNDFIRPLDS
jgi:hypothetical protein